MTDLRRELLQAMDDQGYTYQRLLDDSGLKINISSLNRKLNGEQALDSDEGCALARVLRVRASSVERAARHAADVGGELLWSKRERAAS